MDEEIFFEDIFKSLLEESKEFTIEYDHKMSYYKDESFIDYSVKGVNETKSSWQFKAKIKKLCKEGLEKLQEVLEVSSIEDRLNLLEYFAEEFSSLRNIVTEKEDVHEETEWGPAGTFKFNGFVNLKFSGTKGDNPNHQDSIERKAESYANGWLEIINDSKAKIDFLVNQIELLPKAKKVLKDADTIQIFYSWQSDNDAERKLIRKGLTNAAKALKKAGKTVIIDSDMRGVPGSQDIPNTLFKKIEKSDIFIADVNLVFSSLHRENVLSPNPNVLIELGFAAAKLGWERVIMILDTETQRIEDLPFDIRQRSILWHSSQTIEEITEKLTFAIKQITK